MLNEWHTLFTSLGFSDTETKVYLACLELGPAAVQDIAKKSQVSRVTTYNAIETLTERGLMSAFLNEKRKRFMVEPPDRLISYAESRIKHAEDAVAHAKESIEDLKVIQKGEGPTVKIFEGPDALTAIQNDVLQSKPSHIDEIVNFDELDKIYDRKKEIKPFVDTLDAEHTKARLFVLRRKKASYEMHPFIEKRINLDPDQFNFKGDIMLYGNKIALSVFRGKQFSVILESKDLAETLKALFDIGFNKNRLS